MPEAAFRRGLPARVIIDRGKAPFIAPPPEAVVFEAAAVPAAPAVVVAAAALEAAALEAAALEAADEETFIEPSELNRDPKQLQYCFSCFVDFY